MEEAAERWQGLCGAASGRGGGRGGERESRGRWDEADVEEGCVRAIALSVCEAATGVFVYDGLTTAQAGRMLQGGAAPDLTMLKALHTELAEIVSKAVMHEGDRRMNLAELEKRLKMVAEKRETKKKNGRVEINTTDEEMKNDDTRKKTPQNNSELRSEISN